MGLGISTLIGLKATVMFLCFAYLRNSDLTLLSMPFLYASLVDFLVSIASLPSIDLPLLLRKNPDGTFPIWSKIMFSPYLNFVWGFLALRRLKSGEDPYSEVSEGLYVGGWPYSPDKLPRMLEFLRHAYLCILAWDTRALKLADVAIVVRWACRKRALNRPVFMHCAYGMLLNFEAILLISWTGRVMLLLFNS